jgi:hypothetical protein
MPERGFHYFPSPESRSNDLDNIAYAFLYCSTAVAEWPAFRQYLETTGLKSRLQCDQIEKNAINVLREVRDVMFEAIETDNLPRMKEPKLLQRLMLAHAYLALHADPSSIGEYRNILWAEMPQGQQADFPPQEHFARALWEGKWNESADKMPLDVIRIETRHVSKAYFKDGLYDTVNNRGVIRRDPVARAREPLDSLSESMVRIDPLFLTGEPINQALEERQLLDLISGLKGDGSSTPMRNAFSRAAARQLFIRAGLKPKQASFGVKLIYDDARQTQDPTAWRAIYRKRSQLLAEARKVFGPDWGRKYISHFKSIT